MPTAAVLAGPAGLLVPLDVALAAASVASLLALLTFELMLDARPLSSELMLLAALPVAVASTLDRLLWRDAASAVMEDTSDDRSDAACDRRDEMAPDRLVAPAAALDVMSEPIEAAMEVAPARSDETSLPNEARTEEAVWRGPPGVSSVVVASWAWGWGLAL